MTDLSDFADQRVRGEDEVATLKVMFPPLAISLKKRDRPLAVQVYVFFGNVDFLVGKERPHVVLA